MNVTVAGAAAISAPPRCAAAAGIGVCILFCYLALAPVMALFAYVRIFPIAWSVVLSFYGWDLIRPLKPFIGFANYRAAW